MGKILLLALVVLTWGSAVVHATAPKGKKTAEVVKVKIATVNNYDMIVMLELSKEFEAVNPDIKLEWIVLEENVLRQRMTTDISTNAGQFDVMTIGAYETPIWAKRGWLVPITPTAEYDVDDLIAPVRNGASYQGKLHAVPFYAESSMMFYNKKLFQRAGLTMPDDPSYDDVARLAAAVSKLGKGEDGQAIYGITLRGKAGWGENMAYLTTLMKSFGGRYFDEKWQPIIDSDQWKKSIGWYVDIMRKYGPPGAAGNGFNENQALFSTGRAGIWIDATSAAGRLSDPSQSGVVNDFGWTSVPKAEIRVPWFWSWNLAIPKSSKVQEHAQRFLLWATSKEYIRRVGETKGWASVPPGIRKSTYTATPYKEVAFAPYVLSVISSVDLDRNTTKPVPYRGGVQFIPIPEFQAVGTLVGQEIAAALAGDTTVEQALTNANKKVYEIMKKAGYYQ